MVSASCEGVVNRTPGCNELSKVSEQFSALAVFFRFHGMMYYPHLPAENHTSTLIHFAAIASCCRSGIVHIQANENLDGEDAPQPRQRQTEPRPRFNVRRHDEPVAGKTGRDSYHYCSSVLKSKSKPCNGCQDILKL